MITKSRLFNIFFLTLPLLSGCAVVDNRGHEVEPEFVKQVKIGVSTKDQVRKLLGTPSSVSPFGNKTWYYMYEITERRAFLSPTVISSNITRVEFDDKNIVTCIDVVTENDRELIKHVGREESTAGHTFGVLEQIFGNFGRFNGKDPDK